MFRKLEETSKCTVKLVASVGTPDLADKNKASKSFFAFLCHPVCGWICSSPCLLTRLSGSGDAWPRHKSRMVSLPSGCEWKLVIKSGRTPKEDLGGDASWVYKEPPIWGGRHIYIVSGSLASYHITLRTSLLSEQPRMFYQEDEFSPCVRGFLP